MIGHVYIKGQIGSTESEKGVELQDVVLQVEANKDAELIYVHIDSPGGSVNTGKAIAEYLSGRENVVTIAEGLCGSIATQIHLSPPLARRKIVAGTTYFIHNPLLVDVSGNADELAEASAYVKQYEKEMSSMYVKATGAEKAAIDGLMKAETSLTDEECKSLGFVSEVLPKTELKAVAFMDNKKQNKTQFNMEAIGKMISEGFDKLKAELNITKKEEPKALMITTDKGELTYMSEGELPEVGESVMIGEAVAEDGDYTMENGTIVRVLEGVVSEIVPFEEEETVEALKAKIEEMRADHEAKIAEKDEEFKAELSTQMDALKKDIGSNYVPKAQKPDFGKRRGKVELSMKEKAAALKAEREKA
jgi:ATP-dependent protease ClpP protease subunit/microcompartment protein CcmL/EutN